MKVPPIKEYLQHWFTFPENKLFCQVTTVANNCPRIRTMDLYNITEEGYLIFLTDTSTRKWLDLQCCQNIAVCMVNVDHGQITVEGAALLKTSINDFQIVQLYWNHFLDQYWRDFYLSRTSSSNDSIPTSFGLIMVKPHLWEIVEINTADYLKSSRKQFECINNVWTM